MIPHWLWHFIGADGGAWSYWWGGFFSDMAVFGGIYIALKHLNCHEPRCPRLGVHHFANEGERWCRKHKVKNRGSAAASSDQPSAGC